MKATRWAVIMALGIAACGTQQPTNPPEHTPTGAIDPVVEGPAQPEGPREANVPPDEPATDAGDATPAPTASPVSPSPSATASVGGGGGNATPTPSPTPTRTPTPSPTTSTTASPTPTPSPSASKSPSPSPTPSKSPSPSPTPSKSPTPTPTPTPAAASFSSDVVPILREHCAACHKAGGIGAGEITMFNTANQANYTEIKAEIARMIQAIEAGRMPLGSPGSVPDADVETLDAWRDAGAPNN